MTYLYIPTTTLNFNNIFSTESISPISFYRKRDFGYKKLEETPPNKLGNNILLYDKYPIFTIPDDGRDNYPMIIRVEKNILPDEYLRQVSSSKKVSIFSLNQTIYFHPDKIAIFFRSQGEKETALIRSESSLTTKTAQWYRKQFLIHGKGEEEFFWDESYLENVKDTEDISSFVDADRCLDSLKGFAYGYILGAYKSITNEEALIRSELQKLKDTIDSQVNKLEYSFSNEYLSIIDNAFESFEQQCKDPSSGSNFNINNFFSLRITTRRIEEFSPRDMTSTTPIKPFIQLINDHCLNCAFSGNLPDSRLETATNIGMSIKKIVGKGWEGSPYKKYINELLNNIKSAKPFDFNSFDHLAIQSVAAFLLKGDDIETLESFLKIQHRIGNLRLAFAFWGCMYGFAKIPKTLYDVLFKQGNDNAETIHRYLHDILKNSFYDTLNAPPITEEVVDMEHNDDEISRQLKERFVGIERWLPTIQKLLERHSNKVTKKFFSEFKKKKIPELGGKLGGISKKDVENFFTEFIDKKEYPHSQGTQKTLRMHSQINNTPDLDLWFYRDSDNIQKLIKQITPDEIKNKILEDLEWFRKNWKLPESKHFGYKSRHAYANTLVAERTDEQAIKAFCNLIKNNITNKFIDQSEIRYQDVFDFLQKRLNQEYQKFIKKG